MDTGDQTPPHPTRFAHNGDVAIAFDDLGGAGGEPLLLVMGLGVSRFWWPAGFVAELIGRGFHVARFDQRDAGESTHLTNAAEASPFRALLRRQSAAYSAEDMTDDAIAVMDSLGWRSAHLFGHSMGGLLVQRTALRHPHRVCSITSSAALPSDATGPRILRYLRLGLLFKLARQRFPAGREGDIAAGMAVARGVASPGYPFDEVAARAWIELEADSGVRDPQAQSRQIGAKWHGGHLSELRVPALVLHGNDDQILRPAAGRDTANAIPGARLVTYPGVGHDIPRELWPSVASEIRALADQTTPQPL
ncbi:alpha/beta fold hydrolase [Plantactinospora sp. CA-294935]|uniref:alpha/beta fold hydrolase n=1 Tax=Plantactinospora sp. CA-294935 TaxID=3240012 RepID=UPI003D8E495F